MPSDKSLRSSLAKKQRNRPNRAMLGTFLVKAEQAIEGQDRTQAEQAVREAVRVLDKVAGKGIIHPNKAARKKSRLMKRLHAAQATSPSSG